MTQAVRAALVFAVLPMAVILFVKACAYELDRPIAYYSNAAHARGEEQCVFVDTKDGKKSCSAFSLKELKNMEHRWAD